MSASLMPCIARILLTDAQVLMREHGDLYQRMVHVYPHVQQAIHA